MAAPARHADSTMAYYAANAAEYAAHTNGIDLSPLYKIFEPLLAPASLILDLGCGGGRDARRFASLGHHVIAMDPCPELLHEARRHTPPDLGHRIAFVAGAAPRLPLADSCCSAVWACASLLHLPRAEMRLAIGECSRILRPGGVFLISLKEGTGEGFEGRRAFTYWRPDELKRIVDDSPFHLVLMERSGDLAGGSTIWMSALLQIQNRGVAPCL